MLGIGLLFESFTFIVKIRVSPGSNEFLFTETSMLLGHCEDLGQSTGQ
jgi:hypothetical protein